MNTPLPPPEKTAAVPPDATGGTLAPQNGARVSTLTLVWLGLLTLSSLNYYLAEDALTGRTLVALVFGAVFIKLALVISTFMELRTHGRAWLLPALGFMALVCGALTLAW